MALSSSSRPAIRGRVLVRLPATLQAEGGLAVNKVNGVWTFSPDWSALALETTLPDPGARQLWVYNPDTGVYTRMSMQAVIDELPDGPAGATGATGPASGLRLLYDSTTTDADPGDGDFRLNHATPSSATAIYIDNLDTAGATISAIVDKWDDSTNTTKGYLRVEKESDATVWGSWTVTGSVVDGTGYRKVTLSAGASNGTFTAADAFRFTFYRAGDKGLDGSGTGDVSAASNFGTDNALLRADGVLKGAQASILTLSDTNNLGGGVTATPFSAGSKSSGTFTPDPTQGNIQHYTNGGAHTLAPPTLPCTLVIECTNASAGALTTSGFSIVSGDTYSATGTKKHIFYITKTNSFSQLHIVYVTGT